MKCPICGNEVTPERSEMLALWRKLGGKATSPAKAAAARRNAKLGGWPKGKKRKPHQEPETQ